MTTILTILSLMWLSWIVTLLLIMRLLPQDEQLGAGRAALWRKGTITLEQLLSLDGNPLTLAQLEKRYL